MTLQRAPAVFLKELKEHIRDKRTIWSIVMSAFVGPGLIFFIFQQQARNIRAADNITLPVIGQEHAPELMDFLAQQDGLTIVEGPEDPATQVREGDIDFALEIEDDFAKDFAKGRPAGVKLFFDAANQRVGPKLRRIRRLVNQYSSAITGLRLIARGVSPAVARPVALDDVEVSSAQRVAGRALLFVPMFLLISAFTGGIAAAIDATAGERERGSLESLLANPVSTEAIAVGKWLAASVIASANLVLAGGLMLAIIANMPTQELGMRLRIGPEQFALMVAAVLPVAFLGPALEMLLGSFARSFKEAQSYVPLIIFIPMMAPMVITVMGVKTAPWMAAVPVLAQNRLIEEIMAGEIPAAWEFGVAAAMALAIGVALVSVVARLLRREAIVFGR